MGSKDFWGQPGTSSPTLGLFGTTVMAAQLHNCSCILSAAVGFFLAPVVNTQCTRPGECQNKYDVTSREFYRTSWGLTSLPRDIPAEALLVDLRGNSIPSLPSGAMSHLTQLKILQLKNNAIVSFDNGSFAGMGALKEIWADANRISRVEPGAFAEQGNLEVLSMDHNQIQSLDAEMFQGLEKLETLWVRQNRISELPVGVFDSLPSARRFQLEDNLLTTLSPHVFVNQPRPLELALSEGGQGGEDTNTWDCSSLCWLKHEEEHKTLVWVYNHSPQCAEGGDWSTLQCGDKGEYE